MHTHVCRTASSSFAALRQLRSIRHLISAINIIIQSQLLLLWSSVDCTMAMAHRLAGLLTYLVGAKHSSETGIPSPLIWPHSGCTRQHPLAASAWNYYFQDRRADLPGSPWLCPQYLWQFTPIADIRSQQRLQAVFYFRWPTCSCHQAALDVAPSLSTAIMHVTTCRSTRGRIKVFRGPRLDRVMGPYPAFLSSYRTLPHWMWGIPLKRGRLSYSFGDGAKVDWGEFYPHLPG